MDPNPEQRYSNQMKSPPLADLLPNPSSTIHSKYKACTSMKVALAGLETKAKSIRYIY
jgi:hypothetical protein